MNETLRNSLAVLTILSASACGGRDASPTSPTTSTPPAVVAPPPVSPNAIPIIVGQKVGGVVSVTDSTCFGPLMNPPEPCQRFAVAISQSGYLDVLVTASGPSTLTLGVGVQRQWGVTSVTTAVPVLAGSTYEILVALHDPAGAASQRFELTTSYEPH